MLDELLKRFNVKYEDLTVDEKETLHSWMSALEQNQLSVERIKEYVSSLKDAVENEIAIASHEHKQDIFLKARLRNYLLLEAFLSTPEKAKKQMERQLSSLGSK